MNVLHSNNPSSNKQWTKKYEPKTLKDIVGNTNLIKDAMKFIKNYKLTRNSNTQDIPKAMLITGPGGCGKTSFASILALYRGYIPIESTAALLRKKEEIQHFIDIWNSDVTHNYSDNHPLVKKAKKYLIAHCTPDLPVGKCLILDEVDAVAKTEKGLISDVIELLKKPNHDPDTIMMITCDPDTAERLKTLRNYCYCVNLRAIADDGMLKLINRVSEGENLPLSDEDKQQLINYANGDARRLLNGMEMCFKNGIAEYTPEQTSDLIKNFVQGNDDIIRKLQYSTWSAEKILSKVVGTLIAPFNNNATANITTHIKPFHARSFPNHNFPNHNFPNHNFPNHILDITSQNNSSKDNSSQNNSSQNNSSKDISSKDISSQNNSSKDISSTHIIDNSSQNNSFTTSLTALISVIEPEINVIPSQLFQTYVDLLRLDIPLIDQISILADTVDEISEADILQQQIRTNNPNIMSEDMGDCEGEDIKISDYYIMASTLIPITRMRRNIAKSFKTNVFGYAKVFGLLSTLRGQNNTKIRLKGLSPFFNQRENEELGLISEKIANMLKYKQYDKITAFLKEINALEHPSELIDELTNIKILPKLKFIPSEHIPSEHVPSKHVPSKHVPSHCDEIAIIQYDPNIKLTDIWKTTVKRDFTKEFTKQKPKNTGVKFTEVKFNELKPNKLETNGLQTNELQTNKSKTNELQTNELQTNESKTNELQTNELQTNELKPNKPTTFNKPAPVKKPQKKKIKFF